MATFV